MALQADWRVFRQTVIVKWNQRFSYVTALSWGAQVSGSRFGAGKCGAVHKAKCQKPYAVLRSVKIPSVKRVRCADHRDHEHPAKSGSVPVESAVVNGEPVA